MDRTLSVAPHPPILRAPPFPGVRQAVAAISQAGAAQDFDAARIRAVAAAIAAARVGGAFWGPPGEGRPILLIAGEEADLAAVSPAECVVRLTAGASRRLAARVRRLGFAVSTVDQDPWPLIDAAREVRGRIDSEVGLLALVAGVPAIAEKGLITEDERLVLLHAALLSGVAYRDPYSGAPCDVLLAIERLAFWRGWIDRNRGIAAAAGMAWWKRAEVARFLWDGGAVVPFLDLPGAVARAEATGGAVAVWPSRVSASAVDAAAARGVRVLRMEDGFLRSPGLGSDLHPPLSVVLDAGGIYYDPATPSDLEAILARGGITPALLARAEALRQRIIARGIGKYGVSDADDGVVLPAGRRVVLVAGQVEDDLSVVAGGAGITGNLGLLERARAAEPDAWILFRPHPDVEAGHRRGAIADREALRFADALSRGGSLAALLDRVDSVHVLSSLTGFEALLRGCEVVVHGQPFFAGWGLTRDLAPPLPRRSTDLELNALVAATLILYPRYLDPATGLPCPPEIFLEALVGASAASRGWLVRLRRAQGRLRRWARRSYVAA